MRIRIVHVNGNREVFECEISMNTTIEEVKTFYQSKTDRMRDDYNFVIYDPATGKGKIIDDGICTGSYFASLVSDKLQPYVTVFIYNKGVRIVNVQSILQDLQDSYFYLLGYLITRQLISAARRMEPLTIVVNASSTPLTFTAPVVTRTRALSIPCVRAVPIIPSSSSASSTPPSASVTPRSIYSPPIVPVASTTAPYAIRASCPDVCTTFSQSSYTESFLDPRTVATASIHTPTITSRRFIYPSLTPSKLTTDSAVDTVEFTEGLQVPATYLFPEPA